MRKCTFRGVSPLKTRDRLFIIFARFTGLIRARRGYLFSFALIFNLVTTVRLCFIIVLKR